MSALDDRLFTWLHAHAASSPALRPGVLQAFTPSLSGAERGEVFTCAAYLGAALTAASEDRWLRARGRVGAAPLVAPPHLAFLAPVLDAPVAQHAALGASAAVLCSALTASAEALENSTFRDMASSATLRMVALLRHEDAMAPRLCDLLHRAFEGLDEILGLHYRDEQPDTEGSGERLFAGSGAAVQSSYVTVVAALRKLGPAPGAHLIDLGSGYGRVGLAAGLAQPDLQLDGYEYVGHRVRMATAAAERAGLGARVRFHEQDLGDAAFVLPAADIYYLYDPLSAASYGRVMAQISAMAHRQPVAVVTKGHAADWLEQAIVGGGWSAERYDFGNMCLFRSPL